MAKYSMASIPILRSMLTTSTPLFLNVSARALPIKPSPPVIITLIFAFFALFIWYSGKYVLTLQYSIKEIHDVGTVATVRAILHLLSGFEIPPLDLKNTLNAFWYLGLSYFNEISLVKFAYSASISSNKIGCLFFPAFNLEGIIRMNNVLYAPVKIHKLIFLCIMKQSH